MQSHRRRAEDRAGRVVEKEPRRDRRAMPQRRRVRGGELKLECLPLPVSKQPI